MTPLLPQCWGQSQDPGLRFYFLQDTAITEKLPKITVYFNYFKTKTVMKKSQIIKVHNKYLIKSQHMRCVLMPTQNFYFNSSPSFLPVEDKCFLHTTRGQHNPMYFNTLPSFQNVVLCMFTCKAI